MVRLRIYEGFDEMIERGLDYCTGRGLDLWRLYLHDSRAEAHMQQGRFTEAVQTADLVLRNHETYLPKFLALVVVGRVRARRGDPEVWRLLDEARSRIEQPGEYLCYEEHGELQTVALTREWTRIGRSLAADVRLDDPTVSRRHALIVRHPEGVRLLDDRSLNGVFVNDKRVESKILRDGDEIIIGRYRVTMISVPEERGEPMPAADPGSFHEAD